MTTFSVSILMKSEQACGFTTLFNRTILGAFPSQITVTPNCHVMKSVVSLLSLFFFGASLFATHFENKADLILQNPELAAYHGWIRYLNHRVDDAFNRLGAEDEETVAWIQQHDDWITRILDDPDVLQKVRGTQEWAYLSSADSSGQPFRFATPTDYDPGKSYGLLVYMHGYSGNHIEHMQEMPSIPGCFRISILGRARGGFYQNLSENDVMEVIRYMMDHWNIDPRRVHLSGGSMGGWATFYLSNRYPHLVASARPTCGFAPNLPVGNWLHVPFYATHSKDDPVVPVVMSRVPLKALMALGGQAVRDETDGLGHAAWDYQIGNERGDTWYRDFRAPALDTVDTIDYTATDGIARQAYWATIETWGEDHRPARMQLRTNPANDLYVQFTNVKTISIDVAASPLDASKDLEVSLNGAPLLKVEAPLPGKLFLTQNHLGKLEVSPADPWSPVSSLASGAGKHFPGGARNLYDGEPLLVVWGTGGTPAQNAALKHAAEAAMRSAHPAWTLDSGEKGPDGVVHEHMTYSRLKGKPDVEVTEQELRSHHLVLIGSAHVNAIARKLAPELPVTIEDRQVSLVEGGSGASWQTEKPLVFLTTFNPVAQQHLLYWVSAETEDFLTSEQGVAITSMIHTPAGGMDFALFDEDTHRFLAARNMNSNWQWIRPEDASGKRLIPEKVAGKDGWYAWLGEAYKAATGADVAIVVWPEFVPDPLVQAGVTQFADMEPFFYNQRLALMELNAEQMRELSALFSNIQTRRGDVRWSPATENGKDDSVGSDRIYKVVMTLDSAWSLAASGRFEPESLHYLDITALDAYRSFLGRK